MSASPPPCRTVVAVDDLLRQLVEWAQSTTWVDWLEVGGSLGRDAGDDWSDIDAGIGVVDDDVPIASRVAAVRTAACGFAPVADVIVQDLGGRAHLIVVLEDGRQLSLVVVPASTREGVPPQSKGVLDRSGRLAHELPESRWAPSAETLREWSFEAWICVGDAARHAVRGHPWRAVRSLTEARDFAWQLWAAAESVTYPQFGAVSVENAGLSGPTGIERTLPPSLAAPHVLNSARELSDILSTLTAAHGVDGVERVVRARIVALESAE